MAVIAPTTMTGSGKRELVETTLAGTDSFVFSPIKNPVLILRNATVGALTPVIDGAAGTTVAAPGIGPVDVSAGYSVGSIAAGDAVVIPLSTISAYLQGAIAVTGGTGIVASLLEY